VRSEICRHLGHERGEIAARHVQLADHLRSA
jgi:hypothetical protein